MRPLTWDGIKHILGEGSRTYTKLAPRGYELFNLKVLGKIRAEERAAGEACGRV